jgi:DNA-directed RNA polymerase subunit M/transcription elongation factor TFIIS
MHTGEMRESDGNFQEKEFTSRHPCRKCGKMSVTFRVWESNCGGYEDHKYTCTECGATWWVDGSDS